MKKLLLGLAAISLIGAGGVCLSHEAGKIQETLAAEWDEGETKTIYASLGAAKWWFEQGHSVCAHCWKDGVAQTKNIEGVSASLAGLTDVYSFAIPADTTGFTINCYQDGVHWTGHSEQTVNLSPESGDLFKFGDLDTYGKYTGEWSTEMSTTVYLVNGAGWGTPKCYYWGGSVGNSFPGDSMAPTSITLSANSSNITIYSFEIPNSRYLLFDDGVGGSGRQTGDQIVRQNGVYFMTTDGKYTSVVNLLVKIKSSLAAANIDSDGGKEYANTVCGISPENAGSIKSAYSTLIGDADADIVAAAQNSTLTTYDPTDYDSQAPVAIKDIIKQLGGVAGAKATLTSPDTNGGFGLLIGAISIGALLSVGGLFLLRKRKAE